ncbi:MAG: ribosomal RNA small subunit methyltransferase A [Chloroflexi bacterium]|nr:ribosomal RNA small subunit methyltransferase A [Chloroflexota bacterium]
MPSAREFLSPVRILKEHGLRPKKGLGQNFLVNPGLLDTILATGELSPSDTVLEVGAGVGTLTQGLASAAGKVIAVELDAKLIPILRQNLAGWGNVQIVEGDILKLGLTKLVPGAYKLVGNLPYYLTSHLLRHFLEVKNKPRLMVLTMQREVAERIVAPPGEMSILAVSVQFYSQPRIVTRVPRGAFYPPPKVTSAVVRIEVDKNAWPKVGDRDEFFRLVRAGFAQRRKYLRNSLGHELRIAGEEAAGLLAASGLAEKVRAQDLRVGDWVKLYGEWQRIKSKGEG